jgi:hypothetical protein
VTLARLRREEAELAAFHAAVLGSLPWRIAETLRGFVGRSWIASSPAGASVLSSGVSSGVVTELVGLEQRVRELAEFRAAVLGSKVWRLLQRLRRLAGREW